MIELNFNGTFQLPIELRRLMQFRSNFRLHAPLSSLFFLGTNGANNFPPVSALFLRGMDDG